MYFVGDLGAARRCAHDEDAAGGELIGISILLRGERRDQWRHPIGKARNAGDVECSRSKDERSARPVALIRPYEISRLGAAHRRHRRVGPHRSRDCSGISLDELDDFGQRTVAIGIGAAIAEAGEAALPIGREQAQGTPTLGAPRMGNFSPLQHHMIDRAFGKATAHRQAGMPSTDDDCGNDVN